MCQEMIRSPFCQFILPIQTVEGHLYSSTGHAIVGLFMCGCGCVLFWPPSNPCSATQRRLKSSDQDDDGSTGREAKHRASHHPKINRAVDENGHCWIDITCVYNTGLHLLYSTVLYCTESKSKEVATHLILFEPWCLRGPNSNPPTLLHYV